MAKKLKAKEADRLKELKQLPARTCTEKEFEEYLRSLGYSNQRIDQILIERAEWSMGPNGLVFSRLPDVTLENLKFCFNKETHTEQLMAFYCAGGSCPKCDEYSNNWTKDYLDMMLEPFDI